MGDERSELIEAVGKALRRQPHSRERPGEQGERWLDCRCPLHDDRHRSASFALDRGTFHCRVCSPNGSIPLAEVAQALAVGRPLSIPAGSNGRPGLSLQQPKVETLRCRYSYFWANGELSHHHWRFEYQSHPKGFAYQAPGGQWHRPDPYWPLYGDLGCPQGAHVIVVEGEKAADAIACRQLLVEGRPVVAWTAGSAQELVAAREVLAHRLRDVQPASITLWPDYDEPGLKAMRAVHKYLGEQLLGPVLLDVGQLDLPLGGDAVEFLLAGGDVALLVASQRQPARGPGPRDVAQSLVVLQSGGVLWPGTQSVSKMDTSNCSSLWQAVTGRMPLDRQAKELLNLLRAKHAQGAVADHWRVAAEATRSYWRSAPMEPCVEISAQGLRAVDDCSEGVLLAAGPGVVNSDVDLNGREGAFEHACNLFGLSELERTLCLAWLVCCLTGRQAPILVLKGQANTGKSTFARFLLGLVEPTLPELDANSKRGFEDERQLVRQLQQVPAILLDNISSLAAATEDLLCRLVTGYGVSIRTLYTDTVEQVRMRRGIIITTTNWDVYKGDLASRIVVCSPRLPAAGRLPEETIEAQCEALMPAARGWAMRQAQRFFAEAPRHANTLNPWRVSSVGLVLSALGYDSARIYGEEAQEKARFLNENDPWIQGCVDIWERENKGGEFLFSIHQIIDGMRASGLDGEDLPRANGAKFPRWAQEKRLLLMDHGFWVERVDKPGRGYWFRRMP